MRDFYRAAALGLSYSAYSQPLVLAVKEKPNLGGWAVQYCYAEFVSGRIAE